jgi:hypothetical protein
LAAWGQKENGEVIGLIGAFGPEQVEEGKTPHLVSVPLSRALAFIATNCRAMSCPN